MSTPIGVNQRRHLAFPCVTQDTCVVQINPGAAPGADLLSAISSSIRSFEAAVGRNYPDVPSTIMLQSSGTNDMWIKNTTGAAAGRGYKVAAGDSLMVPLGGTPADPLLYECVDTVNVLCYF